MKRYKAAKLHVKQEIEKAFKQEFFNVEKGEWNRKGLQDTVTLAKRMKANEAKKKNKMEQ